jgi:hypothetical protein
MSKGNNLETDVLATVLQGASFPAVGSNVRVALHTADPGEAGTMATNEATYTGYARATVPRSGSGWTVVSGQGQNAATITFPECTAGSNTLTHFSVGYESTDEILYFGTLDSSLSVSPLITPTIPIGGITISED